MPIDCMHNVFMLYVVSLSTYVGILLILICFILAMLSFLVVTHVELDLTHLPQGKMTAIS